MVRFCRKRYRKRQISLEYASGSFRNSRYHCEQAAEKALKSYLIFKDSEPPRTHDLKLLCKICSDIDQSFIEISQYCINLTPYGIQPRYPFEIEINDSDMQKAIADADQVLIFIEKN
jgi:HEPN domain-containing protein